MIEGTKISDSPSDKNKTLLNQQFLLQIETKIKNELAGPYPETESTFHCSLSSFFCPSCFVSGQFFPSIHARLNQLSPMGGNPGSIFDQSARIYPYFHKINTQIQPGPCRRKKTAPAIVLPARTSSMPLV